MVRQSVRDVDSVRVGGVHGAGPRVQVSRASRFILGL
jgi:hypothetical protein